MKIADADLVVQKAGEEDHSNFETGLKRLVQMNRANLIAQLDFTQEGEGKKRQTRPKTTPVSDYVKLMGKDVHAVKILAETSVENGFVELRFEYECTQEISRGKATQIQWATTLAPPLGRWFVAVRSDLGENSTLCLAKVQSEDPDVKKDGDYARIDFEVYEVGDLDMKQFKDLGTKTMSELYPKLVEVGKRLGGCSIATEWGGENEIRKYIHSAPFLAERVMWLDKTNAKGKKNIEEIRCDNPGIGLMLWGVYGNSNAGTFYCDAKLNYTNPSSKETSSEDSLLVIRDTSKDYPWQFSSSVTNRLVAVRVIREGVPPTKTMNKEKSITLPIRFVSLVFGSSSGMSAKQSNNSLNWVSDQNHYLNLQLKRFRAPGELSFEDMLKEELELDEGIEMTFDPSTCVLTIENDPKALAKVKAYLKKYAHRY